MSDDKSSDLIPRILTAVVGIPLLLLLIFWTGPWGFFGLVAAASAVSAWEYCSIAYDDEHPPGRLLTIAVSVGLVAVLFVAPGWFLEATLGGMALICLFFLFFFRDRERVSHQLGASITAMLYAGVFLGVLVMVHAAGDADLGPYWVLLTMVVVWSSDTGAYFVGRAFGSHPLYESVSPNKSIEGAIGGLLGSLTGAALCNWLIYPALSDWTPLGAGLFFGLVIPANLLSQSGDLVESLVKRAHAVKDSGTIIYGHGGILDRIDGLIFAAPWFYICVVRLLPLLR